MSRLTSFRPEAEVAVIGASGGIGHAFCEALAADPAVARVHALSRSGAATKGTGKKISQQFIDIHAEQSIADAAAAIAPGSLDLVLVATGLLHRGEMLQPERRLQDLDPASIAEVLAINAIGPALVAKHFLPRLRNKGKTVFAALSARVGSISDNRLGGWASYRASKAALNQLIRTIAIEHARLRPESILVSLHPGTVRTSLSEPFTSRTPEESIFSPEQAASCLLGVIDGLNPDHTGGFFAWDGTEIEY